jgi:hypothetical protein
MNLINKKKKKMNPKKGEKSNRMLITSKIIPIMRDKKKLPFGMKNSEKSGITSEKLLLGQSMMKSIF